VMDAHAPATYNAPLDTALTMCVLLSARTLKQLGSTPTGVNALTTKSATPTSVKTGSALLLAY
jgi:hypothetical protein